MSTKSTEIDGEPLKNKSGAHPVEVPGMEVLGADVMAGIHEDGSIEVRIRGAKPVNPETAAHELDKRLIDWGATPQKHSKQQLLDD